MASDPRNLQVLAQSFKEYLSAVDTALKVMGRTGETERASKTRTTTPRERRIGHISSD